MLVGVAENEGRIAGLRARRRLTSDDRAGRFARRKALRLQEQFIRRTWKPLLGLALLPDLFIPGVWLLHPRYEGFWVGLLLPIGPWLAIGTVVMFSGAASMWMGRMGEVWTSGELRWARRMGWQFVNDVHLASQIDHLALGPAGILVIETKWAADPWRLDDTGDWRRRSALRAVEDQARHVRGLVRSRHSDAEVTPVVVLWHPPVDASIGRWHRDGGTTLVDGPSFRDWLTALPTGGYDPVTTAAAWGEILGYIGPQDRYKERAEGPAPRTLGQLYWLVAEPVLVALAAVYTAGVIGARFKSTADIAATACVAVAGYLAALARPIRRQGLIWGSTIVVVYGLALLVAVARNGW